MNASILTFAKFFKGDMFFKRNRSFRICYIDLTKRIWDQDGLQVYNDICPTSALPYAFWLWRWTLHERTSCSIDVLFDFNQDSRQIHPT